MSLLHDALKRRGPSSPASARAGKAPRTDALLAAVGYSSSARRAHPPWFLGAGILLLVIVTAYVATTYGRPGETAPPLQSPSGAALGLPVLAPLPATSLAADNRWRGESPKRTPARAVGPDHFALALYYQRTGDVARALTNYRAVLDADADNVSAHNNLGLLYRDTGHREMAVQEFERALGLRPGDTRLLNNLGVTELEMGLTDAAAATLDKALAADAMDVGVLVDLALARQAAGRDDDARQMLLRAVAIDPSSAPAQYNLASLSERTTNLAQAVEHYRAFLRSAGPQHADRAAAVQQRLASLEGTAR